MITIELCIVSSTNDGNSTKTSVYNVTEKTVSFRFEEILNEKLWDYLGDKIIRGEIEKISGRQNETDEDLYLIISPDTDGNYYSETVIRSIIHQQGIVKYLLV